MYIPNTEADRREMLNTLGLASTDDLFAVVPPEARVKDLRLPAGMAELDVTRKLTAIAGKNKVFPTVFRGAGAYRHYIPAAVKRISANESFLTAYTPYQAELSQGILQSIFEYQSMICSLTGMDASNASVYDGASAAAEAVNMCRDREKNAVYVSASVNPQVIETIQTYCFGYGIPVTLVPVGADGTIDRAALKNALAADKNAACLYLQSPNYFGLIEDMHAVSEVVHAAGALLVAGVNPISLGILESPGEAGADIAAGEGQPLGLPLAFGGPYLGFMACKEKLIRKLPGRIIGETVDPAGERAFVLTLQAREQHIRREKASSNICSNEAHCALTAAIYLSVMGAAGLAEAARQCHSKAAYALGRLSELSGFSPVYQGAFFNEFVTHCPDTKKTLALLEEQGILGGLPLQAPGAAASKAGHMLWCVTELNTKEEIDTLAAILKGAF
jgi:glycine dehydrogenase subunit 1